MSNETISLVNCFRCYVEIDDRIYRILIKDIASKSNSYFVRFDYILTKLEERYGIFRLGFRRHRFWILTQTRHRFELIRIRSKDYPIGNGSKIYVSAKRVANYWVNTWKQSKVNAEVEDKKVLPRISTFFKVNRTKDSLAPKLTLIDTVDNLSKTGQLKWEAVSKLMKSYGYLDLSGKRCRFEFQSLVNDYVWTLNSRLNPLPNEQIFANEVMYRLDSMNLKPCVTPARYDKIQAKREQLAINQTINWLLIQTTGASMDTDFRTGVVQDYTSDSNRL